MDAGLHAVERLRHAADRVVQLPRAVQAHDHVGRVRCDGLVLFEEETRGESVIASPASSVSATSAKRILVHERLPPERTTCRVPCEERREQAFHRLRA
jgi:hypothetical protein